MSPSDSAHYADNDISRIKPDMRDTPVLFNGIWRNIGRTSVVNPLDASVFSQPSETPTKQVSVSGWYQHHVRLNGFDTIIFSHKDKTFLERMNIYYFKFS